jgi:hypothetical protein
VNVAARRTQVIKSVEGNPWLSIWTEPRKTIRLIINANPKFGFLILSAVYGLPVALDLAQSLAVSANIPIWAILIGSLVICTFIGVIGISISAWLLQLTGRWIGGQGNFQTVRAAVTWSNVPNIATILMWLVLFGVFGGQVLNKEFSETQFVGYHAGILFLVMLIETIVSIWGFVILINALAEVQKFSIWRALLNVVIPFVAVAAIIWVAGWVLWGTGAIHN